MRQWASCRGDPNALSEMAKPVLGISKQPKALVPAPPQAGSSKQHKPKAQDSYDQVQGEPMGRIHGP
jgi:hypothetical protein